MNGLLAPLLFVHGLAHLVGFAGPWRLIDLEGVTFQGSLFDGRLHVSGRTMRALAIGWLLLACGFLATGIAEMLGVGWWDDSAMVLLAASFVMCVGHWPAARVGAFVNLGLFVLLQLARAPLWP